ncbi:MAG TPA: hypothetical protein VL651_03190 [Bacteroidia bacterium]|jgi:hypothetical protein|nr:hypothetical protein [Bacteroidia bacterium]
MKKITSIVLCSMFASLLNAQQDSTTTAAPKDGQNQFLIMGNAQALFFADKDNVQFTDVDFKPIFLWKLNDRLFVESEVEIETGEGSPDLGLEYANMCYKLNPYMIFHAGRFLPKFGAYRGRMAEGFLNRFATDPAGWGDGGIGAMNEVGVGLQGGIQVGLCKMNYDLYLSNGPQLLPGSMDAPDEAGQFEYEAYIDNNKNKAIGGRVGFLPFPNSCMEIGYSFQQAAKTGEAGSAYENVGVFMQAVDMDYFHKISQLKSIIRINGEWKQLTAGDATYYLPDSLATPYTFKNESSCYYGEVTLRPAFLENKILSRFEVGGRYSQFTRPTDALWGGSDLHRTEVSLDYWMNWNSLIKLTWMRQDDAPDGYYAQIVFGF